MGELFFRLVMSVGIPYEESNLKSSDSALRCSATEPQRPYGGARPIKKFVYDTSPAYC